MNNVVMSNSEPAMPRMFVRFLRDCYDVPPERLRLSVNCFLNNGLTLDQIESHWLEQLELPRSCLRKGAVNRASSASKGVRPPLVHGTARVALGSTFVVQSIFGAIQEYAGVDRPEWLDIGRKPWVHEAA